MFPHKDYDYVHRRYYIDHPSSRIHHEPYIVPLQNQYSALSHSRNPYHVLDHLNFQVLQKHNVSTSQNKYANQSLDQEIKQWSRRHEGKQSQFRSIKSQLKDLSNLLRRKEDQYERQKLANDLKSMMANQSKMMGLSMLMPYQMGGCPHQMMNSGCGQCRCQCSCNHHSCSNQNTRSSYKPVHTQNIAVQSPSLASIKISSKRSVISNPRQSVSSFKPSQPKKPVQLQKRKRADLLRRFRKCVYAVYFCIYFKWFSAQFSINRYSRFKKKYLDDEGKDITRGMKELYERMCTIDIPRFTREAAQNVPEKGKGQFDIPSLLKAESVKRYNNIGSTFKILSNQKQTLFQRCVEFITLFLQDAERVLGEWQWGDLGEALGVGSLNQTFMIDSYFLPHEIFLVNFHEKKGYAKITPDHQRMEVMIKFIVKMLLFNVCFQLDNNRDWLILHEEELTQKGDINEIFVLLEISAKMVFIICQFMYEKSLEGQETNYDDVAEQFKIEPCNPLVYNYSIRKRRQLFKSDVVKDSNLLIFGIQQLDQINSILNDPSFKQGKKKITNSINSLISQALGKLKESNIILYKELWDQTLDDEYIVLRGLKKIQRSTRYYPFLSNTVIPTKKTIANKQLSQSSGTAQSIVFNNSQSLKPNQGNHSQVMTYKSDYPRDRSSLTKMSIAKRIPRNR